LLFIATDRHTMPTLLVDTTLLVETVDPAEEEEENYQASLVLATVEAVIGPCGSPLSSAAAVLADGVAALTVCNDSSDWTMVENAADGATILDNTAHDSQAPNLNDVPFDEDPMDATSTALVRVAHCSWTMISRGCVHGTNATANH
jgi:hypothetical protein